MQAFRRPAFQAAALASLMPFSACTVCALTSPILNHRFFASHHCRSLIVVSSSSSSSSVNKSPTSLLPYQQGPYHAAEVHALPLSNEDFWEALQPSLAHWQTNDYKSAWIYVPAHRTSLIETLTAVHNFDLHHVTADQVIVLKKWLDETTPDKVPPFCTHQVGCAGLVLNDNNEMLLVQEWRGPTSNRQTANQWKLPGGLLDAGESLEQATCREVLEETGIKCEFESVLTFWHRHGLHLGKSDLYFVSLLKPLTMDISKCPQEISDARWMSIDEFFATGQTHPLIRHVLQHNFQISGHDDSPVVLGNTTRVQPKAEMVRGAVQWPHRDPYPTYSSVVREQ